MGPSTIDDARQRTVDAARRLRTERTRALAVLGAVALAGAALATLAPLGALGSPLAVGWVALSAAAGGWLALTLFPRRRRETGSPGLAANVVDEHELHAWAVGLSHRIDVSAPGAIRIAPTTGAWLEDLDADPTLVIGAGSLGWLTTAELERIVGIELAMLRVREDDGVRSALRVSTSVRLDRLCTSTAPVVGPAVRLLGRRLAERLDDLREACVAWALETVPPELTPTETDVKESALVEEAWDLLTDRWIAPAAERGIAIDSPMLAHRELLAACEESGLIERDFARDSGPAALTLLSDAVALDRELGEWTAAQLPDGGDGVVGWDEYVERVALPTWRQTVADAVSAAGRAIGQPQPPTLDALLKAIESGQSVAVGTSLFGARARAAGRAEAEPTAHEIEAELATAIAHSASLALVESGLAAPDLDILWGVGLVDDSDEKLSVDASVRSFLGSGDVTGLRWYLQGLGLDTSRRLPLLDAVAAALLPAGKAMVAWQGWRPYDVVVTEDSLRAYRHGMGRLLHDFIARLTGAHAEIQDLDADLAAALDADDPDDQPLAPIAVAIAEISEAELHRSPRGTSWSLRVEGPRKEIRLKGLGDARLLSSLLDPMLGDRVRHTGLGLRPNWRAAALGKVSWYTIWGGAVVLLAGAVGLVNVLDASRGHTDTSQAVQVVATFGVFGAALIAIGLVPYRFIARRGQEEPGLR